MMSPVDCDQRADSSDRITRREEHGTRVLVIGLPGARQLLGLSNMQTCMSVYALKWLSSNSSNIMIFGAGCGIGSTRVFADSANFQSRVSVALEKVDALHFPHVVW